MLAVIDGRNSSPIKPRLVLNEEAAVFDAPSVRIRQRENSFAAPYTNDVQLLGRPSIYDSKRRMDELADVRVIEFRDDPAHVRVVTQRLYTLEDLTQQANADIGPALHGFEVSDGRLGESNDEPGHVR